MKGLLLTSLLLIPTPSHGVEEDVDYEDVDDICVYLPDTEPEYSEEALAAALQASDYAVKLADLLKTETDRGRALMRILEEGRFDDASKILPLVSNVNFHDRDTGLTPLLLCCGEGEYGEGEACCEAPDADYQRPGQAEMMRKLLEAGADPNLPRAMGTELPLIKAARSGDTESMRLLLAAGANPHFEDSEGKTALQRAAEDGRYHATRLLLELPNMPSADEVYINPAAAVERNDTESLKALLQDGISPNGNYEDDWGETKPLTFIAAHYCSTACLQILMEARADIQKIHNGYNALSEIDYNPAVNETTGDTQAFLLQAGLGQHKPSVQKAIRNAIFWHDYECAKQLIPYNAEFGFNTEEDTLLLTALAKSPYKAPDKDLIVAMQKAGLNIRQCGATALIIAAKNGYSELFFYLMEQGAPLTAPNELLIQVLTCSGIALPPEKRLQATQGREKVVRFLIEQCGADVNTRAETHYSKPTALMLVVSNYDSRFVTYILERGANLHETDDDDHGVLDYVSPGDTDTLRVLLKAGAEATSDSGQDLLRRAAWSENEEIVRILLELGTSPNRTDSHNKWTALHFAAMNADTSMVNLLLSHGADANAKSRDNQTPLQLAQQRHPNNTRLHELLSPKERQSQSAK